MHIYATILQECLGLIMDVSYMQLEDACNSKQEIQFCGVGAHHQNGVSKRAIRAVAECERTMLLNAIRLWPE